MKFYDREDELALLKRAENLKTKRSIFTLIIGRRRVGKTTLALHTVQEPIYFFISRKNEALLCEEFSEELKKYGIPIFGTIQKFSQLFEYLLSLKQPLTIIIDEFQEFLKINPAIFADLQKIWDLYKDKSNVHLIVCGSIYSLMKKIFEDAKAPLFGRADFKIDLQPFKIDTLKEILQDNNAFNNKNWLDFFTITGGVAKYIELFSLYQAFDFTSMIDTIISPNSLFLDEGKNRLIEEFGKEYTTYFSILSLIASSKTSRSEIESILQKNVSGHLERLEKEYNIIRAIKPITAKPNSKLQKYEINDNFLSFWFRFIYKYQSFIEAENFSALKEIINRDFLTYEGKFLEKFFLEKFKNAQQFTHIGTYWERGNKNEIDLVAVNDLEKKIIIAEVKIEKKRASYNELLRKATKLLERFKNYEPKFLILGLEDMDKEVARL